MEQQKKDFNKMDLDEISEKIMAAGPIIIERDSELFKKLAKY